MQQSNQNGFIVLAMFVMLTLCATMVSLFLTRGTIYRYSMNSFVSSQKMHLQLQSGLAVAQSLLAPEADDASKSGSQQPAVPGGDQAKLLMKFLLGRSQKVTAEIFGGQPGVIIDVAVQPESGKININSLYDFANKKFVNEGEGSGDRKKVAEWMFDRISQTKGGSSLFVPFSNYLKKRGYPLNDVTELLLIPEFAHYFEDALFLDPQKKSDDVILYLTDLFTVVTETDTIQPWVLSPSLITLLGGSIDALTPESLEDPLKNFSPKMDWAKKWNETVGILYGIKFDNLPEEMKSILTQQFEVNMFSIALSMRDEKNKAGLYSLLKQKTEKNGLSTYDIVRMYQI